VISSLPNIVEFLEMLGFKFEWCAEEKKCHIRVPQELEGINVGFMVDAGDLCKDIAEFCIAQKWAPEITAFVRRRHQRNVEQAEYERKCRLVGGPFDGEPIPQSDWSSWGKTFPRKVRKAWWAVYIRKGGKLHADFVGFATSESKAMTKSLVGTFGNNIPPTDPT
jgi:hypothetical protein